MRPSRLLWLLTAALSCALAAPAWSAPVVRPWSPASADSITGLAAEAMVRFRQMKADTLGESEIIPFEKVGQAARRLLRRLGREQLLLAPSIESSLDSLGLDTDVVQDPAVPNIVLVLVRNPFRLTQQAVGYLLWYRGPDLRMQGVSFPPCIQPQMRSWWTGQQGSPYATAVLYRERREGTPAGFVYLRLAPDGFYWNLVQYEGRGPDLGPLSNAGFVDANRDGLPELVAYSASPPDSIMRIEPPVQPILREVLYTDRGQGFIPHEARYVGGPLHTLRTFVSLLRAGDRDGARALMLRPDLFELVEAAGWARTRTAGSFVVDRQEEGQPWPEWYGVRVLGVNGMRRWVVHFAFQGGRWLIRDVIAEEVPRPESPRVESKGSTGGHRP
jgi:hypothetical protein